MVRNLLAHANTSRTQSSIVAFSNDPYGLEAGDVALQDMPRLSTETQRRNGFVQSAAEDRGTRIAEDMRNGNYQCCVCADTVASENTCEYSAWHCWSCYNVFHLECVKRWADASGTASFTNRWKCPFCAATQDGEPTVSCWCGKESFNRYNVEGETPNACQNLCRRATQCPHGHPAERCNKPCHPGPCNAPCKANCPSPDAPVAAGPALFPSAWTRFQQRFSNRTPGTVSGLIWMSVTLFVIYGLLGVFLFFHNKWWTQPYRYPDFLGKYDTAETMVLVLGGFVLLSGVSVLVGGIFEASTKLVSQAFNLSLQTMGPTPVRKRLTQFFGLTFLLVVLPGILALPIIGFAAGPFVAWYSQMRDSCFGYDTRIQLDKYGGSSRKFEMPAMKFDIRSLAASDKDQTFYLSSRIEPASDNAAAPFQQYYRLSGSTENTTHMAVDVDLENKTWRAIKRNQSDEVNRFLAGQYDKGSRKVPPFSGAVLEVLVRNGTFSDVTRADKHMDISGLDLRIANMADFIDSCDHEPFLRVYRTADKSEKEKEKIGDKLWSKKYDEDIVMRTASFGHGRQRLDMCVKEDSRVNDAARTPGRNDMVDELYVPMAIITAYRLRLWEQSTRTFLCYCS